MNTGYKTIGIHVNDALSGLARTSLAARLACRHGREVLLGGASRTILRGMTVPVLTAH